MNNNDDYEFWADKANQTDIDENFGNSQKRDTPKKTTEDEHAAGKVIASVISIAVIFAIVVGVYFVWLKMSGKDINMFASGKVVTLEKTKVTEGNIKQLTNVSDIVSNVMPSIVSITDTYEISTGGWFFGDDTKQETKGSGSGIIIAENDKEFFIATNNHVINGAKDIEVTFVDDKVVKGSVKGTEASEDLAVISIKKSDIKEETLKKIKKASIGSSDNVKAGDNVIAIGNALGYGQSVTCGYVSAVDRKIDVESTSMKLIQIDAAINPGNSGGALLNSKGEVIGINSAKLAATEVEGIGYAIPITKAKGILDDLVNTVVYSNEEKGFLGIEGTSVTDQDKKEYGYPVGVFVSSLIKDGAAAKAGIKERDIITKIDKYEVKSIEALVNKMSTFKKGSTVKVTVMRYEDGKYKEKTIDVKLTGVIDEKNGSDKGKAGEKGDSNKEYIPKIPNTLPEHD